MDRPVRQKAQYMCGNNIITVQDEEANETFMADVMRLTQECQALQDRIQKLDERETSSLGRALTNLGGETSSLGRVQKLEPVRRSAPQAY